MLLLLAATVEQLRLANLAQSKAHSDYILKVGIYASMLAYYMNSLQSCHYLTFHDLCLYDSSQWSQLKAAQQDN